MRLTVLNGLMVFCPITTIPDLYSPAFNKSVLHNPLIEAMLTRCIESQNFLMTTFVTRS